MDLNVAAGQIASYPLITGAIIGLVQIIKQYVPQVTGGITIIVAAILGLIVGLIHINGIDAFTGVSLGLGAVGIHVIFSEAGGGSTTVNNTQPKA